MPGHTAAHERASKTYNRSRNLGGQKVSGSTKRKTTTTKSNNNRTRIQDEKQKEFEKTYQANEFSGTGKTVDTSKYRDLRLNRFYQGGEVKTPIISLKPFEKVLNKALKLPKSKYEKMSKAGIQHAHKNYKFEDYENSWINLIDEVIETHGSWDNRKNYKNE